LHQADIDQRSVYIGCWTSPAKENTLKVLSLSHKINCTDLQVLFIVVPSLHLWSAFASWGSGAHA